MGTEIRILHVLGALNRGGAETMVMNLYRNIDRSKIQFDFVVHTTDKCDYDDEINELGGKIHHIPRYKGENHFEYKKAWRIFFQKHPEYKIVHGHMRSTASIYLGIAKKYNLKTIAHSHSTSSGVGISGLIKNIMQLPIRYKADYFFACSDKAGKWLFGKNIISSDKYKVIKNAIDADSYIFNNTKRNEMREALGVKEKFVVGHVGRFSHEKNHEYLIKVFYELQILRTDAVLLLIGDGKLRCKVEQQLSKLGISEKVIFTGVISNVSLYMQAMDIFVLPSHFEGLGIVTVEAQAVGLPCIVSNAVPEEAYVTCLIKSIPLKKDISLWVNGILNRKVEYNRLTANLMVRKNGYNIVETSKWIENFYINC